jgi:hypothetical protein
MATVSININKEVFSVLKLPFRKKYIVYTSIIFFLQLASIFLSASQVRYKVSTVISLNNSNQSAGLVAEDFNSKVLVLNTINQLPFKVNYYKENSPKAEIYGDSLPVELVFDKSNESTYTNNLVIKSLSSHSFSIEHEDTIQFYELNERINRIYGKFKVVRGPAFTPHFQTVIVRLNEPVDMLGYYYNNLVIEPDESNKIIALSILVNNAQKGQDFLNKLLELYSKSNNIQRGQNAPTINLGNIRIIEKPEDNIKEISPNAFLVYLLALLLGLLMPRLFTLINNQNASIMLRQWFNRQILGDKLKIWFGVRQVD